ncbi:NUDIX domain-containing protein [Gangjinia marincola]|uniref:NUDIX domain-containing protein n=1 Tax=Gangjinia marincola TaxID=578463 RepID=A0ABN1MJD4_9FLAO
MYPQVLKTLIATDCIIVGIEEGTLKLLVIKRPIPPLKDRWSLIGTFLGIEETAHQAAHRVLYSATGLNNIYLDQLHTYTRPDRDPGGRVISIAHFALIRIADYHNNSSKQVGSKWFALNDLPKLIFDHDNMVNDALAKLRERAKFNPIAFELLSEYFTLKQLQNFYEELYQQKFDTANFRKKVLSYSFLVKTNKKVKDTSKKGSFLYRYDRKIYEELRSKEFKIRFI